MWSQQLLIEQLTDELRLITRGGPNPMRLATLPTLRALSRVDGSLKIAQVGSLMSTYLQDGIGTLGPVEVEGNPVSAEDAKLCVRLLLRYKGRWMSLPERRYRVLSILGSPFPIEQMRRPHSPERELLRALAAHLVAEAEVSQITS